MPLRPRTGTATTSREQTRDSLLDGICGRLEMLQIVENFHAVLPGIDVEIVFADDAVGIDEKRVAGGKLSDAEIQKRIVGARHLVILVRQEFEMQSFFRAKVLVRIFILAADAEDHGIFQFELSKVA